MSTITIENTTLTIINGEAPPLVTAITAPTLLVTQIPGVGPPGHAQLALSIPGVLVVTVGTIPFVAVRNTTIAGIRAAVGVSPTGADIIFDVNRNGTTIFTTQANRPRIADGATVSALAIPDVTTLAAGDVMTVDVDQVGSGVFGSFATIVLDCL